MLREVFQINIVASYMKMSTLRIAVFRFLPSISRNFLAKACRNRLVSTRAASETAERVGKQPIQFRPSKPTVTERFRAGTSIFEALREGFKSTLSKPVEHMD